MIRSLIAVIGLSAASFAHAVPDFSAADAMFKTRSEGLAKVMQARDAYKALATTATGEDKVYAIAQMSRLDFIRGELLLVKPSEGDTAAQRKAIFEECLTNVDAIKPSEFPASAEIYYTWKITCFAFWGEAAGPLERLGRVAELKALIKDGLELTTNASGEYIGTYDGGAMGRYVAAVYANPGARPVGLYKPEVALKLATAALAAGVSHDRAFPLALKGSDYYENVWVVGDVLRELGQKSEAVAKLEAGITELEERIADEELPAGREYEANFQLAKMKSLLVKVQSAN
jgi:hypothetical protein